MHVRPLIATDTETASAESTAPFGLAGILFELSDERELKRRYDTKEQLLEWVRLKLHDDLTGLLEDATLVQQLSAASGSDLQMPVRWDKVAGMGGVDMPQAVHGASRSAHAGGAFQARVRSALSSLEKVQRALAKNFGDISSAARPLDVYHLLDAAVTAVRPAAGAKRVQLDSRIPRLMGLVKAQPDQLAQLLRALLEALLADAAADSRLKIRVDEADGTLAIRLDNVGFGIPDEHLQAFVWQPEYAAAEEFKDLRQAVLPVAGWGGDIQIRSEVGVGMWASLRLQVVT